MSAPLHHCAEFSSQTSGEFPLMFAVTTGMGLDELRAEQDLDDRHHVFGPALPRKSVSIGQGRSI